MFSIFCCWKNSFHTMRWRTQHMLVCLVTIVSVTTILLNPQCFTRQCSALSFDGINVISTRTYRMLNRNVITKLKNYFLTIGRNRMTSEQSRDIKCMLAYKALDPLQFNVTNRYKSGTSKRLRKTIGIMNFSGVSCRPLFPDVLLFNRIFKTGSTSMETVLINASTSLCYYLKKATTEDWYNDGESYPYPEIIEKHVSNESRVAFSSHFYFRSNLMINRTYTYMNIVRNPIRRVISHYRYMRAAKMRPKYRVDELKSSGLWNESLGDCIRNQHRGCEDNTMTRFFCGTEGYCKTGSRKAFLKAASNIDRFYASVGLLEMMPLFLEVLKRRIPTFFKDNDLRAIHAKRNLETEDFARVDKHVLKLIRDRNRADISLYKFVKKRFLKQVNLCKLKL